jgi:N-acetyl-alpha-D-glucosaminyl L-malate synthase BshA
VAVLGFGAQGGSGNVARMMAGGLGRAGHDVTYVTARETFWGSHAEQGVRLREVSMPAEPVAPTAEVFETLARDLVAVAKEQRLDVVWAHYGAGLLGGALMAKRALATEGHELKVAVTLHGTDVTNWGRQPQYRDVLRNQLLEADEVTAVSEWLSKQAQETFDLPSAPRVVANAIRTETFQPNRWLLRGENIGSAADLRRQLAPNGETLISHASNFRAVKRPLDLLEAFKGIHARMPAKLVLMGETDPAKNSLLVRFYERALELGIADDIVPVGVVGPEAAARYYAASDLSLVTSQSESFSLAALESMAVGVPVIGTRCGGLDEVMRGIDARSNGSSRLLVNVGDTKAMAQKAVRLLNQKHRYHAVQRAGLQLPFVKYSEAAQLAGYFSVLDELSAR